MVNKKLKAFSLLEIILIMGAFIIMTLIFLPIGINELQSSKVDNVVKDIRSQIYTQSQSAYTFKNNKDYGIALFQDHYIIFTGTTLAQAENQTRYDLSAEIKISEINLNTLGSEIVFVKGSFKPNAYGSFKIITGNVAYQITINSEGLLLISKL